MARTIQEAFDLFIRRKIDRDTFSGASKVTISDLETVTSVATPDKVLIQRGEYHYSADVSELAGLTDSANTLTVGSGGNYSTLALAFTAISASTNHTVLESGLTLTGEVGTKYGTLDVNLTSYDSDDDYALLTAEGAYLPCYIYEVGATSKVVLRYPHAGVLDYATATDVPSVLGAHVATDTSIDVTTQVIEEFTFQAGDKVVFARGTAREQTATLDSPPYSQGTGTGGFDQLLIAGGGITGDLDSLDKVENLSFRQTGISFVKVHRYSVLLQSGEHDLGAAKLVIPPFTSIVGVGETYLQNGLLHYNSSSGDTLLKNIKIATTKSGTDFGVMLSTPTGGSHGTLTIDACNFQSTKTNQDVIYMGSLPRSWYGNGGLRIINGSILRGAFDVVYASSFSEILIETSRIEIVRRSDVVTSGTSNAIVVANSGTTRNFYKQALNIRNVIFNLYNPDGIDDLTAIRIDGPSVPKAIISGSIQQCEFHVKAEAASSANCVGITISANPDVSELMIDNNYYKLEADGAGTETYITSSQAITVGKRNVTSGFAAVTLGGSAVFDSL